MDLHEKLNRLLLDDWAEVAAFDSLLRALYGQKFRVRTIAQLQHIVQLADYYRALPTLSACLTRWLEEGDGTVIGGWGKITKNCVELLEISFKLRCSVLFKDCLLICIGGQKTQRYAEISTDRLRNFAERECSKMRTNFFNTITAELEGYNWNYPGMDKFVIRSQSHSPEQAWENLIHEVSKLGSSRYFSEKIRDLTRNRLVLVPYINHRNYFLFLEVSDHDLPWDLNEKEW